ncbi:hypothetical protein DYB32_003729 [Aphanomyces invadans]|uniref:Putative auto-transporter adhesin head GIN domain-containing protein n=1 Tax=Aphanomyces invadans TaxID=157072 RepID=A0A3R6VCR1_9STRA|nr:hypothetical protein DYB32_003729 [Aphanomyces invadans]
MHVRSWSSTTSHLGALSINLPGRVVVSCSGNATATTTTTVVTVTSTTPALLSLVQADIAITADDINQLTLRLATSDVDTEGTLLVHVTLGHPVHTFSTVAETLVESGALAVAPTSTNPMYITSYSNAAVWIESSLPVAAPGLSITTSGAGDVYFSAPSIHVERNLKVTIFAQGSVSLQSKSIYANTIKSEVPGRGSVFLQGDVQASHLISDLLGMGSVNYFPFGSCNDSKISIVGSGNAYLGSVACVTASVNTVGNGDAYVQVAGTLVRSGFGSGSINYFNGTPKHLPENSGGQSFPFVRQPTVAATTTNKYEIAKVVPQPPWHEGSYVLVRLSSATLRWPPILMDVKLSPLMDATSSIETLGIVGIFVLVVVGILVVVTKRIRRGGYELVQ